MTTTTLKRGAIIAAVLIVAVLVFRWWRTRILPAPEAIQKILDESVAAVEDGDVGAIMKHISSDFRGDVGGDVVNRQELKGRLFVMLRRGIGVEIVSQDVEIFETEATVTMVVALWRGGARGAASGDASLREIEVDFRLEGSSWKVVASRQTKAGVGDVF